VPCRASLPFECSSFWVLKNSWDQLVVPYNVINRASLKRRTCSGALRLLKTSATQPRHCWISTKENPSLDAVSWSLYRYQTLVCPTSSQWLKSLSTKIRIPHSLSSYLAMSPTNSLCRKLIGATEKSETLTTAKKRKRIAKIILAWTSPSPTRNTSSSVVQLRNMASPTTSLPDMHACSCSKRHALA